MLKRKLADVHEKIKCLERLETELAGALRNCNRELRLKREIRHGNCCPLLTKLDRMKGSAGNKMSQVEETRAKNKPGSRSTVVVSLAALGALRG